MENIILHLKEVGLNEKQARVYVALIEIGKGTAYAVAKKAKVKRPTTYVILEELRLKGLALKIPHDKNQIFIAKDPYELFAVAEEKLSYAKRALPELLARVSKDKNKASTYFFEGLDGIKQALEYKRETLADKELLCFYAQSDKGPRSIPKIYHDHDIAHARQHTKIRAIAPKHFSLVDFRKTDKSPGRQIISLPESEFSTKVSVEIADSFVRIFMHKNMQALIVENKDFTDLMRQNFEIIWKAKDN